MGKGLVRSLQPPDILWIHQRVYNSIANTKQAGTLSTPFWCLCQKLSLSPLYFNKTLLCTHTNKACSFLVFPYLETWLLLANVSNIRFHIFWMVKLTIWTLKDRVLNQVHNYICNHLGIIYICNWSVTSLAHYLAFLLGNRWLQVQPFFDIQK